MQIIRENLVIIGGTAVAVALTGSLLWYNLDRLNAKMLDNCVGTMNKDCAHQKRELFKVVNDLARKCGPNKKLKVLEIGGGTGANFEFIDESIEWTALDPNEHCLRYYTVSTQFFLFFEFSNVLIPKDKVAQFEGQHTLAGIVQGYAEDLSQFPNESFDVVIETLVFCSVKDVDRSLKEVQRVLKPGGVFCFLDHVKAGEQSWTLSFQNFLTSTTKLWPKLCGNCHLNRSIGKSIQDSALFNTVKVVHFTPQFTSKMGGIMLLIQNMIYGHATKGKA